MHRAFSLAGGPAFRFALTTVISLWLIARRGRPRSALLLIAAVAGASTINTAVKVLVARKRPPPIPGIRQAGGYSFPSGHTTGSVVLTGALTYLIWNGTGRRYLAGLAAVLSAVVTTLVGISRVARREHHRTDVMGGYVLGLAWLVTVLRLLRRYVREESPS